MVLVSAACNFSKAEEGPVSDANRQLRVMFSQLDHPTNFLYERAAHIINEAYFSTNCNLYADYSIWYFAYQEMYNSAKDQTQMLPPDSVVGIAYNYGPDTVSIGVMDYSFGKLKYGVLSNHDYFEFDTITGILTRRWYDNPRYQTHPYTQSEIFMVAPVVEATHNIAPVFCVNDIVFTNTNLRSLLNTPYYDMYIDFGDGSGNHTISLTSPTYISVCYPEPGTYTMVTTVVCHDGEFSTKQSKSTIVVGDEPTIDVLDYYDIHHEEQDWESAGMNVVEFTSNCSYDPTYEKIIFVLSGYNPASFQKYFERRPSDLFQKYIVEGNMTNLPALGYKIVIIDWKDPNDDIRANAERFAQVLNYYKCNANNEEQFVVIGHSMGCLIGRYALTALENEWATDCMPEKMHNTRLFISNDGPHQGVNIPMSLQTIYGDARGTGGYLRGLSDFMNAVTFRNLDLSNSLLNATSVKQMLNRHYSTGLSTDYYTAADEFYDFFSSLEAIGDYPRYCKLVALSNGSMEGAGQQNVYYDEELDAYFGYTDEFRTPNDRIFNMENELKFTVLGLDFGTQLSIDIRSNPDGAGPLFDMYYGTYKSKIKLYWFGVRVTRTYEDYGYSRYGDGLLPYCTAAGGSEYMNRDRRLAKKPWGLWMDLGFLGLDMYMDPGSTYASFGRVGIPWLLDLSDELYVHTDGFGFGFVPVRSAFDYGDFDDPEINVDFTQMHPSDIMENTPFDVLIGRIRNEDCSGADIAYNGNHEDVLNPVLEYNPNRDDVSNSGEVNYSFCDVMPKCLLNAEIGDEDLYLNNNELVWDAAVSAYNTVIYDEKTPFYTYEDYLCNDNSNLIMMHPSVGAVSREEPYMVAANLWEYSNNPTSGNYWNGGYDGDLCCYDFHPHRKGRYDNEREGIFGKAMESGKISVTPTILNSGEVVTISLPEEDTTWTIRLYGTLGERLLTEVCPNSQQEISIPLSAQAGVYMLTARSESGSTYSTKIIVK